MQQYNGYVHVHAVIAFRTWELVLVGLMSFQQ